VVHKLTAADTVVIFPPEKETAEGGSAHGETSEILEKPLNRAEQVSLLPFYTDSSSAFLILCLGGVARS
jgi:septum formation protein